jgi:drug/metabolite transporter (DMT)-like permease
VRGALLGLVGIWFMWGLNWSIMKIALRDSGPWEFTALRNACAAGLLFALIAALRRSARPKPFWPLVAIGILQGGGMNGLSMGAVALEGSSKATILAFTMPLWTLLLSYVFLHERVRKRQWTAIGLAAVGLGLVIFAHGPIGTGLGDALAVGAGLCWALGTVISKAVSRREPLDALTVVSWQNVFGAIPLLAVILLVQEPAIRWTLDFSLAFVYNVVITGVIAWVLWFWILERLPAVTAGMGSLAIPVVGIAGAYLWLGERPSPLQWIGSATILIALAIVTTVPSGELAES